MSNHIKDLVLCVVSVRAETFLMAPHFSQQLVSLIVRACAQQLLESLPAAAAHSLSRIGATQALLDLLAFEAALEPFLSDETVKALALARRPLASPKADQKCAVSFSSHLFPDLFKYWVAQIPDFAL